MMIAETMHATLSSSSLDKLLSNDDTIPALLATTNDDGEDVSSISTTDGDHYEQKQEQPSSSSSSKKPRSIFKTYWKNTPESGNLPPMPMPMPRSIAHKRTSSPKSVRMDPCSHFGIDQEEDKDDSVNTYERTLRQCEVRVVQSRRPYESRPLWMGWFTHSAPSLRMAVGMPFGRRATLSESTLHVEPPKSILRKGRFSSTDPRPQQQRRRSVDFNPTIQVHPFERPVESWAPDGWSSWFG
jgi:hypothetical protein